MMSNEIDSWKVVSDAVDNLQSELEKRNWKYPEKPWEGKSWQTGIVIFSIIILIVCFCILGFIEVSKPVALALTGLVIVAGFVIGFAGTLWWTYCKDKKYYFVDLEEWLEEPEQAGLQQTKFAVLQKAEEWRKEYHELTENPREWDEWHELLEQKKKMDAVLLKQKTD